MRNVLVVAAVVLFALAAVLGIVDQHVDFPFVATGLACFAGSFLA